MLPSPPLEGWKAFAGEMLNDLIGSLYLPVRLASC